MKNLFISNDGGRTWEAVRQEWFDWMPMSEVYTDYGQQVGHYNAGDSLEIITPGAAALANEKYRELNDEEDDIYNVGDIITAYDDFDLFEELLGEEGFEHYYVEVLGHTYWDGHNFKTITLPCSDNETEWDVASDVVSRKLQARLNFCKLISDRCGIETYTHGVRKSNFYGDFAIATIEV